MNVRSQSQELHNNIQHPFAAVEKQEDESDSYTIDQIREKNNSFEKVLKPYPEAQNRRKIQSKGRLNQCTDDVVQRYL